MELSGDEVTRCFLPAGGHWFHRQCEMMSARPPESFPVAWDRKKTSDKPPVKIFGFFKDAAEFYREILRMEPAKRCGYEIIPEADACKLYFDIEWKGQADPEHKRLASMVECMRKEVIGTFNINPEIYVCCGTRPSDQSTKHSYHVVVDNLVFSSNHDGGMKSFAADLSRQEPFMVSGKSALDCMVYTRNRMFRLPMCCKLGTSVPLTRISGDALDDEFTFTCDPEDMDDSLTPFLLARPEINGDRTLVKHANAEQKKQGKKRPAPGDGVEQAAPKRQAQDQQQPQQQRSLPFPLSVLEDRLRKLGDTASCVTTATFQSSTTDWMIQCDQRGVARKCLINAEKTHDSNNCLLFAKRYTEGYNILYRCTSEQCQCREGKNLGMVSVNYGTDTWDFTQAETETPDDPADEAEDESYQSVKRRFERKNFMVEKPSSYCAILSTDTKKFQMLTHTAFIHHHCSVSYTTTAEDGSSARKKFVDAWITDSEKRKVVEIVVDPTMARSDVYNLWPGMLAEALPPVADQRTIKELSQPIIDHIHEVITCGNQRDTDWFLDYLANICHRPERRTQVAILLYGEQGAGKGTIFEFLRLKVLGDPVTFQTQDPRERLFGRFANGFLNRVFIQIDEVPNIHEYMEHLKNMITNETLNYEQKGKDAIVVNNITNLLFTTNYDNVLRISPGDRRFSFFRCSSDRVGDHAYFARLRKALDDPRTPRAFYEYLGQRDLSAYTGGFQSTRPQTEYYLENMSTGIPIFHRFLSACLKNPPGTQLAITEFYQHYVNFHKTGNYKTPLTATSFMLDVRRLKSIRKDDTYVYISWERVKEELVAIRHFDPHAVIQ